MSIAQNDTLVKVTGDPDSGVAVLNTVVKQINLGASLVSGSGILSLGGQTGSTQTFASVDDTNVTIDIASASSVHTATMGWTGQLAVARGGTGAANASDARSNLGLGTLATQNGTLTDYALRANNLSDLTSAGTARTNLGLGALATLATIGTAQIDNDAVTFTKIQTITDNRLLGRSAGSDGDMQHIAVGSGLLLSGGTLSATAAGGSVTNFSFTNGNGLTGVVTNPTTTPALSLSIDNGSVVLGKLATQADQTFLGNNTGGAASPLALTVAQAKTMLSLAGTNSGDVTLAGENYLSIAGQVITAAAVNLSGSHVAGTLAAARFGALTGDVTSAGGSYATTIANNAITAAKIADDQVTLAKIADQADATILGNNTGGASSPVALTAAQTKTLLSLNNVENTALSTWAGSANITTVGTLGAGTWNADTISLAKGGTGVALADPGSDRIMFWDDSAGQITWLTAGTGLTITDTTIEASGGGGTPAGADGTIQYNDGGAFGGMSKTFWDDTTDILTLGTFTNNSNAVQIITNAAGGYGLSVNPSAGSGGGISIAGATGVGLNISTTTGGAITASTTTGQILAGTVESADTNVATRVLQTLTHNSSGSVANSFGARLEMQLETSTTAGQPAAAFQWSWADSVHASRDSRLSFYAVNNTNLVECLRIDPASTLSAIYLPGFSGTNGLLTTSAGSMSFLSPTAGKVIYGGASGGVPTFTTNFHFDTGNTRLAVGAASAGATFHGVANTATTNDIVNGLLLGTNSTGTPANGLGGGIFFNIETSTTVDTNAGQISIIWTDVTHASRTSAFLVKTVNNAGAVTERLRVGGLATKLSGGLQLAKAAKTSNYTMLESDTAITSDSTGGAVTITLPPATLTGHIVHVKRIDASANNTTVSRAGADTIEGANTVTLAAQYESVTLIADGTATWYIIATT